MSLLDKQLFLKQMEQRLGAFIPANDLPRIIAAAGEALEGFEVTSATTGGGSDGDSDDLLQFFLDAKRVEGLSEKSLYGYERLLRRLRNETGVPFQKMTVYHLRSYLSREQARGINDSTRAGYRQCWSSFFGWMRREGLIEKNPVDNLAPVKVSATVREPFSAVEVARLDEAAETDRDRAIIAVLNSSGIRVSELVGLDREDMDLSGSADFCRFKVFGKGKKERYAYLDPVASMLLNRYLGGRTDDNQALFVSRRGTRLTDDGVRFALNKIGARAGVENVHPHRFRRTRATSLINAGMPIQNVQTILGHAKIDTTTRYVYVDEQTVAADFRRFA